MISNSSLFFKKAMAYQDKRKELISQYEKSVKSLSRFKGSAGYTEDMERLRVQNEKAVKALVDEYRPVFQTIIGAMTDRIGQRSMPAPTADEINTLTLLRMKRKLSYEDCCRAAETMKGNSLAIDVLKEIAAEHKLPLDFSRVCTEMSSETALRVVENMKARVEDFMLFDSPRSARVAARYYEEHYGTTDIELPKRREFTDKGGCFAELAGLDAEALNQFCEIIDEGGSE